MSTRLCDLLNRPLSIGRRSIATRLVLAPMAKLGHIALRELIDGFGGAGLMFTEMCSARRIPTENRRTSPYFRWRDAELDRLVCQIFGHEPARMAAAARRIEAEGFFGVDINFGCAAGAICRQAGGAAVLKDPALAERIVAAVRKAVDIPVCVKFRTGWQDDVSVAVALARRFEAAGADLLTFHPRVAPDRRAQRPKWDYIGRVKASVGIPVMGNGDVFSAEDCLEMLNRTGCDGVAVGRMAVARPWLFGQWTGELDTAAAPFCDAALALARLLYLHYDPQSALRRFRKFSLYFSANFLYGHSLHKKLSGARDLAHITDCIETFFRDPPQLSHRPNMNFFR